MPDFGRNSRNDDPSLDAIVNSDRFIDALAAGQPAAPQDQADADAGRTARRVARRDALAAGDRTDHRA